MAAYRIHRLKPNPRQQFRWAPHTIGTSAAKPRDYEPDGEIEAANVYEAWMELRGTVRAIEVGDILESADGRLCICKYVGFEEARWVAAESPSPTVNSSTGAMQTA
jgi:hypothetical protein